MKNKKRGSLAISQAISLILSTIAFAYILGSAFPVVSGQNECILKKTSQTDPGTPIPAPNININDQRAVNDWCYDNGRSEVCDGGSPNYRLRFTPCSSSRPETGAPPITIIPSVVNTVSDTLRLRTSTPTPVAPTPPPTDVKDAIKLSNLKDLKWIAETAAYAAIIYYGSKWVLNQLGASPELAGALSNAVTVYYVVTQILVKAKVTSLFGLGALTVPVIGLIFAAIVFFLTFKGTRYDRYTYTCYPWDAPLGGKDCEKCNSGDFPCTEYQCRTLGQSCELENQGTGQELCVWKNRNDVRPPEIKAWTETLTTGYKYLPDNAISPPDRGVKIVPEGNNNGCIAAFTPLRFGVTLDEPAKCRIDSENKDNFEDMEFFFGGSSTTKYNHSQTMSLPSLQALAAENITLENGGEFTLYTRCQDSNGNANTGNFVFQFCVDKGPDTTAPLVVSTSILNGFPISFGTTSVPLDVNINEPAECKWSKTDQSYNTMENQMSCSTSVVEVNAQSLYRCSTTLNGLNDGVDNNFYFRCKDQPFLEGTNTSSQRNENSQSYKFTLKGTRPLVIDSVKPNGTIKDSTDIIKATLEARTSAGFKEGAALCYFSETGEEGSYVQFFKTGTHQHTQDLFLAEGDYSYSIKCVDLGGNTDTKTTSFTVESDSEAPIVVRAFREGNFLKIITNEEASCVYNDAATLSCNYEGFGEDVKGIPPMTTLDNKIHTVAWNPDRTFYIKCEDDFGNQPLPNECSIIARPFGK